MPSIRALQALALVPTLLVGAPASAETVVRGDCSLTVDGHREIAVRRTCPTYRYDGTEGIFMIDTDGKRTIRAVSPR